MSQKIVGDQNEVRTASLHAGLLLAVEGGIADRGGEQAKGDGLERFRLATTTGAAEAVKRQTGLR